VTREQLVRIVTSQVTKARTGETRQDDEGLALQIIQFVTEACEEAADMSRNRQDVETTDDATDAACDAIRKLGTPWEP
jgi:hypothetical protein